jgi:hypothetical protein
MGSTREAFKAILNAVTAGLHTKVAKVKFLELDADSEEGFSEVDIGVVRDNSRQIKLRPQSTGCE